MTVAGTAGATLDPASKQFGNLIRALRAASDGTIPIVLCSYVPRTFSVGATLIVDPSLDADAVLASAKDALRSAFGFDARDFMQPVYRSEVIAVLQGVPGVISLTLDSLRIADQSVNTIMLFRRALQAEALFAEPPLLVGGVLVGAQLLTLETGPLPAVVHA